MSWSAFDPHSPIARTVGEYVDPSESWLQDDPVTRPSSIMMVKGDDDPCW